MAEDDEPGGSSKPIRGCVVKGADDELWSVYDDDVEDQGPHYKMKSSGRQEYEKLQKVSEKRPARRSPKAPIKKPASSPGPKPVMKSGRKPSPKSWLEGKSDELQRAQP